MKYTQTIAPTILFGITFSLNVLAGRPKIKCEPIYNKPSYEVGASFFIKNDVRIENQGFIINTKIIQNGIGDGPLIDSYSVVISLKKDSSQSEISFIANSRGKPTRYYTSLEVGDSKAFINCDLN